MGLLELAREFIDFLDLDGIRIAACAVLALGALVSALARSWEMRVALIAGPFGCLLAASGWVRRRSARSRETPQSVYLGALPAGPVLVSGRASALIPCPAPATGRPCVYWRRRITSADVGGTPDDGYAGLTAREDDGGIFLIDDGEGKALVWPDGRVRFARGWHENLKGASDGFRDLAEKAILEGATVSVVGRAGTLAGMLEAAGTRGADLPPALLEALQTRSELRGLPCFWPNDEDFLAAEGPPEGLMDELTRPGETALYVGAFLAGLSLILCLGALFGAPF